MSTDRFRLTRGGILNVWQYDEQVFDFGGGRLLLRGTNGAGKSKTLEMLLPFVLDGDKSRITASGRHHTSLLWLLLDGYTGQNRTGYLWVEFQRPIETTDGPTTETVTCGIGLRASSSARAATTWFFTSPRRIGVDLHLSDSSGPLTMQRLRAEVEGDGHFFESNQTRRYREHVGQMLFGLPLDQYEDLLRLLYWLRQPQVGEDIDPKRLAEQLVQALPQVDEAAIRTAGDTFDQLEDFGEQIDRQERAAAALGDFLGPYSAYARGVIETRVRAAVEAEDHERRCRREVRRVERDLAGARSSLELARHEKGRAEARHVDAVSRITQLEAGPEARAQQRLIELDRHLRTRRELAGQARARLDDQHRRAAAERERAESSATAVAAAAHSWIDVARSTRSTAAGVDLAGLLVRAAHAAVSEPDWQQDGASAALRAELEPAEPEIGELRDLVGVARAAVKVVEEARSAADAAKADAERREESVAAAESVVRRWQDRLDAAVAAAEALGEQLITRLAAWQALPAAVPVDLPELSAEGLALLEEAVAEATSPVRAAMELRRAQAVSAKAEAEQRREDLRAERATVEAERDPSPVEPAWRRDVRSDRAGAPLWKLVDFRDDLVGREALSSPAAEAALEAALEASGLLDAWVTPDGRLDGEVADIFATRWGLPPDGPHLSQVLRADPLADAAVDASVVEDILRRITLLDTIDAQTEPSDAEARPSMLIGRDGSWRTGVVGGRTSKPRAQFIGASARSAERARRLEALDEAIAEVDELIAAATDRESAETVALGALEEWQRSRPSHHALLGAWATETQAAEAVEDARQELDAARRTAEHARTIAAHASRHLDTLGDTHGLPTTAEGLRSRDAVLVDILGLATDLTSRLTTLRADLDRWDEQAERARSELARLAELAHDAEHAQAQADIAAAELDELRAAAGASIRELELRLEELANERDLAKADLDGQDVAIVGLIGTQATLEAELKEASHLLEAAVPTREQARDAVLALERAPGLIESALAGPHGPEAEPTRGEEDSPAAYGLWTPDDPRALLERIPTGRRADETAVVAGSQTLSASAAASHEPRIVKVEQVWVALGRGEGGELPLVSLETQLSETVRANKELLSQREREIFEKQVLGYLGDSLRGVRLKAEELVRAMNSQLDGVTTSQGIRVRLRWRLRDDISADAKRAVELLGRPVDALLPDERTELRESLHRLIEASRSETPEDSYAEHLARALDYRRWFAFSVQYHRPETGDWRDLQRKSALSQGEQKVLCYLPLFAAASAHFTSVAGAAPHAPRFVLLDDAFPKIDARTHPLLFGLLVDLDLDFVVTSERLWGTHGTVPELAIYEALRSPGERGIAQFEHRWDGHQLTAIGGRV